MVVVVEEGPEVLPGAVVLEETEAEGALSGEADSGVSMLEEELGEEHRASIGRGVFVDELDLVTSGY